MKKMTVFAAAALAFSAFAAPEKIAVVQFADANDASAAVTKLASLSGCPMLAMAGSSVSQAQIYTQFGPARPGDSVALFGYAEPGAKDLASFAEDVAVAYPISTKEAFLAVRKGAAEKDGAYFDDSLEIFGSRGAYLLFPEDGKWVVAGRDRAIAEKALGEVAGLKPLKGDVAVVRIEKAAMPLYVSLLEELSKDSGSAVRPQMEAAKAYAGQINGIRLALRVGDDGVTFRSVTQISPGLELDKIGRATLPRDALSAEPRVIGVVASAENSGTYGSKQMIDEILQFFAGRGIKLDAFNIVSTPSLLKFDFDVPSLVRYIGGEGVQAFSKFDFGDLEEMQKKMAECKYGIEGPAWTCSFSVKDYTPPASARKRFAATLPEASNRPVFSAYVGSFYTSLLAVAPKVVASLPPDCAEIGQVVGPLLAALPPPGDGAVACASWRKGDSIVQVARISPDELRGLGTLANMVAPFITGITMQRSVSVPQTGDED